MAALADFIGLFNFYSGRGKEDMRVSEAIELMDDKVMAQYQDQPEVASTILTAVGLIHLSFDNIDRAHDALQHVRSSDAGRTTSSSERPITIWEGSGTSRVTTTPHATTT